MAFLLVFFSIFDHSGGGNVTSLSFPKISNFITTLPCFCFFERMKILWQKDLKKETWIDNAVVGIKERKNERNKDRRKRAKKKER